MSAFLSRTRKKIRDWLLHPSPGPMPVHDRLIWLIFALAWTGIGFWLGLLGWLWEVPE